MPYSCITAQIMSFIGAIYVGIKTDKQIGPYIR